MLKNIFKKRNLNKTNNKSQSFRFCLYNNLPTTNAYYYNDKQIILDDEIENYNSYTQAFLQKRRLLKYEIPAKISILKSLEMYKTQFLSQFNDSELTDIPLNTLLIIYDKNLIDTNFIKNLFLDTNEDKLYDNIAKKVFLNG